MRAAILAVPILAALALPLSGADLPRIEELAQEYRKHPPGQRRPLLVELWKTAQPEDVPLLWSLLEGSSPEEVEETVQWIALTPLGADRIPFLARLYGASDERLRLEVIRTWIRSVSTGLEPILRRLLLEAEATSEPCPRKELLQVLLRARAEDFPELWQRLRKAEPWEADLLVEWFGAQPPRSIAGSVETTLGLYRSARTEEEKDRALWIAAAGWPGDERSVPVQRLARAFHSCPNAVCRSGLVTWLNRVARAEDLPVMLEILRASTVEEAQSLSRWFIRNPSPEAVPDLRERLGAMHEDLWIPSALSAAGDPEVLDWAIAVLRRPDDGDHPNALFILGRSPLPAAAEQIRRTLRGEEGSVYFLMTVFVESGNPSPYRWWFLEEVLKSPEHRLVVIAHLRQLAKEGEETAERLLSGLAQP